MKNKTTLLECEMPLSQRIKEAWSEEMLFKFFAWLKRTYYQRRKTFENK